MQIKKAIKAGNSSAVVLPRAWLNKEVRIELVEKTPDIILADVLEILKDKVETECIIGIYLVGSYARNENDAGSDIDVLVVTDDVDLKEIHEGIYNIIVASKELIAQKLKKDLLPIGQMIKEAVPLLNSAYLESIDVKVTKANVKWHLDSTKEKIKLVKEVLKKTKKEEIDARVGYTLVLRIRTLEIIKALKKGGVYTKKELVGLIRKITKGDLAYESYLRVKNGEEQERVIRGRNEGIKRRDVELLLRYLEKRVGKV